MASEDQVNSLMELLGCALVELDKLDSRLSQYDETIQVFQWHFNGISTIHSINQSTIQPFNQSLKQSTFQSIKFNLFIIFNNLNSYYGQLRVIFFPAIVEPLVAISDIKLIGRV